MSKIKLGILGGGGDSLIGVLHRVASNMYDRYQIVGGVFNPNYEENIKFSKKTRHYFFFFYSFKLYHNSFLLKLFSILKYSYMVDLLYSIVQLFGHLLIYFLNFS